MLLRAYLPKLITALFGGLFIAAGVLTFGNALIFDRLFIAILVFTGIVCYKNINVVGLVLILLLQRVLEEFAWTILSNTYLIKILFYSIAFYVIYLLRYDKITNILAVTCFCSIGAEIYWYITSYNPPEIQWYIVIISLNSFIRHMIFLRVGYTEQVFPNKEVMSINLDWVIYKLNAMAIIVQALVLFEFLFRHLFGLKNILLFYTLSPYAMRAIATYAIFITFSESYRLLIPRLLKA
jgi:hypothetical protein